MAGKEINKQDLVDLLATKANVTKAVAGDAIDSFVEIIKTQVRKGNAVKLKGFCTFSLVERAAKKGRNPRTGKPVDIPARKAPKVKFSAKFLQK